MNFEKHLHRTPDSKLMALGDVTYDEESQEIRAAAELIIPNLDSASIGRIRESIENNDTSSTNNWYDLNGRSGHSQIGVGVRLRSNETPELSTESNNVIIPAEVFAVGPAAKPEIDFFKTLKEISENHPRMGELYLVPTDHLSRTEVENLIGDKQLLLPRTAMIEEDGNIQICLDDIEYILGLSERIRPRMSQLITQGKHALRHIQDISPDGLPKTLEADIQFLVSAVRISLGGDYMGVISHKTNQSNVWHMPARLLHGGRTSGIQHPRQVELVKPVGIDIQTDSLAVNIRLYHQAKNDPLTRVFQSNSGMAETILQEGVQLHHLINLNHSYVQEALFRGLSCHRSTRANSARFITKWGVRQVGWEETRRLQKHMISENIPGDYPTREHDNNLGNHPELQEIANILGTLGGAQNHHKVCISYALPPTDTIDELRNAGVNVIIAKSLRFHKEDFSKKWDDEKPLLENGQDLFFSTNRWGNLLRYANEKDVNFYLYLPEEVWENGKLKQTGKKEVRVFRNGFWMKPSWIDRYKKATTMIAMFGSAVDGLDEMLKNDIDSFVVRMKEHFGEEIGFCHGKGPGIMSLVDQSCAKHDIISIGVGISVEKIGQGKPNCRPPVQVDFHARERHTRQNILDCISNIKIYNIGGGGTMEEFIMSVVNTKLHEQLTVPHILVDPRMKDEDPASGQRHLWSLLTQQIKRLSLEDKITQDQKRALLDEWIPKMCILASSYEEAGDKIIEFTNNPRTLWDKMPKEVVSNQYKAAIGNNNKFGRNMPEYMQVAANAMGITETAT